MRGPLTPEVQKRSAQHPPAASIRAHLSIPPCPSLPLTGSEDRENENEHAHPHRHSFSFFFFFYEGEKIKKIIGSDNDKRISLFRKFLTMTHWTINT